MIALKKVFDSADKTYELMQELQETAEELGVEEDIFWHAVFESNGSSSYPYVEECLREDGLI